VRHPEATRLEEGYSSEISEDGVFVLCHVRPFLPVRVWVESVEGRDSFDVPALTSGELKLVEWTVEIGS
jgi:hypothetical protein